MDDYKQYFYNTEFERYQNVDPGDLTKQLELKNRLQCKPFSYYLEHVAPDMLERFPIIPQQFAKGTIKSLEHSKCLGMPGESYSGRIQLVDCNRTFGVQFILTMERGIKYDDLADQCLENLKLYACHHRGGNQHWKFDLQTRQILYLREHKCLIANSDDSIDLVDCDANAKSQKWQWSYENKTALMNWDEVGLRMDI